jgi:autotransporter-associated beta strand protein/YVTN family beta-propeller protein
MHSPLAQAANGTWSQAGGGSWTNIANWSGGVMADGAGSSASFASLSLAADAAVTLDGARTIGSLVFDDLSATKHNWSLNLGSGGPLTLAGTTPSVTVLGSPTRINAAIAGTAGLRKSGTGRLTLGGANTYTGTTAVNAGTLALGAVTFSAASPLTLAAGAVAESAGTLNLSVNGTATAVCVSGAGALRLVSTTSSATSPDLHFGPNHSGNSYWGARLAAPLDLGGAQRFVFGKTGHNGIGQYGLTNADCQFAGPISGSGGLTIIAQNNWTGSGPMEVGFAFNAANSFSGPVEIQRGSLYLGHPGALTNGNVLRFSAASGNNARFFLYGNNAAVTDLQSPGAGSALIANANNSPGPFGPATLTVTQNNPGTFSGAIVDWFTEYGTPAGGLTPTLSLVKRGAATLTLSGVSTYSGPTTIEAGTLQADGSLGGGAVTVRSGATLGGAGSISGPVAVPFGGTLAPGPGSVGTLTVYDALTLAGTVAIELSKSGVNVTCDRVTVGGAVTYGGTLLVTKLGPTPLEAGDSVTLFAAASYLGAFTNLTLPSVGGGLAWDTCNLSVNGSIAVVPSSGAPVFTQHPQSLSVSPGNPAVFTIAAAGPRPIAYQWLKNGGAIAGATNTSYAIASVTTNDAGSFAALASNSFGSTTSLVATLSVATQSPITNGLVVYLNFDSNLTAQAGTSVSGALYTGGAANGPRYKPGVIGAAATFANTASSGQPDNWAVTLGNLEAIYATNFSVSLWERTATSGDGALMGNKNWTSGANVGWVISSLDVKNVNYNAVGGTRRDVDLNPPFSDGVWHLITVTFNRAANQVISYVDGLAVNTSDISPAGTASFNAGLATLVGSSGNGTYSGTADIDDLGIWNRVLTPQEATAIYSTGLSGRPLTATVAGETPVITSQPLSTTLASGGTVSFSVVATGPGPLTYQWRFNGTNLPGATSSTLFLPSVTMANQGVYTVLVMNGAGAAVSSGAVLTVYELAVTGQWDFAQGDLRATVGAELEFVGDTATSTAFPTVNLNGQPTRVMAFGRNSVSQGFYARHGAKPNGGGQFVNQYTLIMDVMFPAASSGQWRALWQTDPYNHAGNDAEFFVGDSAALPAPNGIGAEGQFHGSLAPDTWYRLAFVVDLLATTNQLTKFVNGVAVGSQALSGGIDGRYALGPAALLFTAGTVGGGFTQPGWVSSIQFINGVAPPAAIAALGGPDAGKLPPGNAALRIASIARQASSVALAWTGPTGQFQTQATSNLVSPQWRDVGSPTTNRTAAVPSGGAEEFYRVAQPRPDIRVGQLPFGEQVIPSKQILRAAGQQVQFNGRPVDLALSPDGRWVFIKNVSSLLVVDAAAWTLRQTLSYPGSGASMHGIAVSPDGSHVYVTGAGNELYDWTVAADGTVAFARTVALPSGSCPCGLTISADGAKAYVCLSIPNKLAVVNLASGTVSQLITVGVAPWDVVLAPDGGTAFVSDWGGRFPIGGDLTAASAGTQVVVDSRGVGASGVVSFVNLTTGLQSAQVATDLHPSDLELSQDGKTLYVANANSDTVTIIDTLTRAVKETVLVRPDPSFPYGSAADGLALSRDGQRLYVASAGNNAIAVVELPNAAHTNSLVLGFVPTDWYPGAVVVDANFLYLVNVKGLGTRAGQPATTSWQIFAPLGTANKIAFPSADTLSKQTAQVIESGRVREIKQTQQPAQPWKPPVPVPARVGEPSVFQHVLYIIKENKTYDQMFGDLPQGNGDPSLCIYPQLVSPNHHALAQQYVLLDNFYCNGVNSADGHSWSTEANNTDHLEKSFGGFSRSYTFGDDALTYSSSGFIWNNALQHGLTFRNYGEFDYASPVPSSATWLQIYNDFLSGNNTIRYSQNIGVASLRPYSSTNVPGWNVGIPDVVRAAGFIRELRATESNGTWAAFHLLYLPNDHTGGPPSARAQMADNDLSLGRVVEAVTKSAFGSNTVIFVIEDDPQSGYDHVDGHRSICLVVSPYTKRGQVVSTFYNQAGVLHTMERILGLPPMNQQDAMAPLMFECFTNVPNFMPYTALPSNIALTEGVVAALPASRKAQAYAQKVRKMDFSKPDLINEDAFNRYIWHSIKGDAPYPAKYVGGHGKGLKKLGLVLVKGAKDDDD